MRTARIIYTIIEIVFDVIAILLALRILLRFFGAGQANVLVGWLYDTTGQLIAPFSGIFPNQRLDGTFVVDVAAIIALIVYSVAGYVLLNFLTDIRHRAEERDEEYHRHNK